MESRMALGLIGTKLGMTRIIGERGVADALGLNELIGPYLFATLFFLTAATVALSLSFDTRFRMRRWRGRFTREMVDGSSNRETVWIAHPAPGAIWYWWVPGASAGVIRSARSGALSRGTLKRYEALVAL